MIISIPPITMYRQELKNLIKRLIEDSLEAAPWKVSQSSEASYKYQPENRCFYTINIPKPNKDALFYEEALCIEKIISKIQERLISISREGYRLWVTIHFAYEKYNTYESIDIGWYTRSFGREIAIGTYARNLIRKWCTIFPITEFFQKESVYLTSPGNGEGTSLYEVSLQTSPMESTTKNFRDLIEFTNHVIYKEFTRASTDKVHVTHTSPKRFPITLSISGREDRWMYDFNRIEKELEEFPRELVTLGNEQYRYKL